MLLRSAEPSDLAELLRVAESLDSVNLPADEAVLAELIARSARSFAGQERAVSQRVYLFVLELDGELLGCSMILAHHGTPEDPHYYFAVEDLPMSSPSLGHRVTHKVLRLGADVSGMTELGGLVVRPEARRASRPGKQLSLVRLLYIAMHRTQFCDRLLAELMPPLSPDGSSALWEALGRRLTGLSYREADRRSRADKRFIRELFPSDTIVASLLPVDAQQGLGKVGPATFAAERMLSEQGFRYAHAVDPFDGGPHYIARTDEVSAVREHRLLSIEHAAPGTDPWLVGVDRTQGAAFRACLVQARVAGARLFVSPDELAPLGVSVGEWVHAIPLRASSRQAQRSG